MDRQIIIVTRDRAFGEALLRACSGQGCQVRTTNSVSESLMFASESPVSVLIADASIENINDGFDLAKKIRQLASDVIGFLIVDETSTGLAEAVTNESWIRLVEKPVRMLRFSADVVDVIARSQKGE